MSSNELYYELYAAGIIVSLLGLTLNRPGRSSFFRRRIIMNDLSIEIPSLSKSLEKLRGITLESYLSLAVVITVVLSLVSLVSGFSLSFNIAFGVISITNFPLTILLGFSYFIINKWFRNSSDRDFKRMRLIYEFVGIYTNSLVFIFIFTIFISVKGIISEYGIFSSQVFSLILGAVFFVAISQFSSSTVKRELEKGYLIILQNQGKMEEISVRVRLKNQSEAITGKLLSLGRSSILIEERDGFVLHIGYAKVEAISSRPSAVSSAPKDNGREVNENAP